MQIVTSRPRRENFSYNVDLILIDEVSTTCAEYLVLLDSRLRLLCHESKPFRGKNVLLSGDYLQMASTFGTPMCSAPCLTISSEKTEARNLFSLFKVFYINDQVRAICNKQKRCLEKFRKLPKFYLSTDHWTKKEKSQCKVIEKEIVESLTREITFKDVSEEKKWKVTPTVTSGNLDRIALNSIRMNQFAKETNQTLVKWKKKVMSKTFYCLH